MIERLQAQERLGGTDIDSHDLAAFSPEDKAFLEERAGIAGNFIERNQAVSSDAKSK